MARDSVMISYRREDSAGWAGRIYDHLAETLGPSRVFLDIDSLQPGEDFSDRIHDAIGRSSAVLVLIGPRWLTVQDGGGHPRLFDERDYVRREIAAALAAGIRVIPVLVESARIPPAEALPPDIQDLTMRQAVVVSAHRPARDIDDLVLSLSPRASAQSDESRQSAWTRSRHWLRTRSRSGAVLLGVAAGMSAVGLVAAAMWVQSTTGASQADWVAFESDRSGVLQLYGQRPGHAAEPLTAAESAEPACSPDGSTLAFTSARDNTNGPNATADREIYLLRLRTGEITRVTNNPSVDRSPAWSPDGSRIAFVSDRHDVDGDIYYYDIRTLQVVRMTESPGVDGWPTFTSDGRGLVFASDRSGNRDVYLLDLESGDIAPLTFDESVDSSPAVSPDGQWIAFMSDRDGDYEIYLATIHGTGRIRLTYAAGDDLSPSWSPDGKQIAFSSSRSQNQEIWTMNVESKDAIKITNDPNWDSNPFWCGGRGSG